MTFKKDKNSRGCLIMKTVSKSENNSFLNRKFHYTQKGSSLKTEVTAGLTTFLAMAYILVVNSGMFANLGTVSFDAMYVTTAISAIIGTVLIGLLSNLPLAQAPGMGLNAFFVYTVCLTLGFSYANALVFVLIDGLIFILLTATGLRKVIFDAIPPVVKTAIPAGIGLFIAFLGLQDAKLVIPSESTGVTLASLNLLGSASWGAVMPLIVAVFSLLLIAVLSYRRVGGSILWGILGGTGLYYLLGFTVKGFYDGFAESLSFNPLKPFSSFASESFGKVFTEGFDFSAYLSADGHSVGGLVILFITTALAFCMVDMFDTLGTLYGACRSGDLLVKNDKGEPEVPNMNKAMMADAIATCTGSVLGTSTVTTFVESSAGVAAGGKTGVTSLITSAAFAVALFFAPIAKLIPPYAYGAALVYVGVLMIGSVKEIDWKDISISVPAFLTIAMMPFTYNISYGIAFGLLSFVAIKTFCGEIKEIKAGTWVITALFFAMFFLTH